MRRADLHLHTSASDGASLETEQIFRLAQEKGLAAVTFTDHEGIANNAVGLELGKHYGIDFLPGIEISGTWQGRMAHLLGFFQGEVGSSFEAFLKTQIWSAQQQTELASLTHLQARGIGVTRAEYDAEVEAGLDHAYHMALERLLQRKGIVPDAKAYGQEANIEPAFPSATVVIEAVHEAGGIVSLAHPVHDDEAEIGKLARAGLDGVEVYHPSLDEAKTADLEQVANRFGLLKTGGSDSHYYEEAAEQMGHRYSCDWDAVLQYFERIR